MTDKRVISALQETNRIKIITVDGREVIQQVKIHRRVLFEDGSSQMENDIEKLQLEDQSIAGFGKAIYKCEEIKRKWRGLKLVTLHCPRNMLSAAGIRRCTACFKVVCKGCGAKQENFLCRSCKSKEFWEKVFSL